MNGSVPFPEKWADRDTGDDKVHRKIDKEIADEAAPCAFRTSFGDWIFLKRNRFWLAVGFPV